MADAIRRLWENGGFVETSVVVGVAGLRAITREMDLPYVPDEEVDMAVRFQAEEVIPFPAERTVFSTQVLADYNAPDGTAMRRVLVAAAHRDLVDGVVNAIEAAGLEVAGVDLVSSALVRAIMIGGGSMGYGPGGYPGAGLADQPEAIVSVGAGLTVVVVHQGGRPQFVRTIGTAGNAATAAISSTLDLPMSDAEAVKRRLGEPTPQVQAAEKAVQPVLTELVNEIRNSVQFFASLPGRAPIARILVTGGGAQLRGFFEQLQTETRMQVVPISPLSRLDTTQLQAPITAEQFRLMDPVLATPVGLALPETLPGAKKFNLVPAEVLERAEQRRLKRYAITGGVAALVLIVAFSGWRFWQVHQANSSIASLRASVASLNAQEVRYDPVVRATKAVGTSTLQARDVAEHAVDWPAVLDAIGPLTPANLSIVKFDGTATFGSPSTTSSTSTSSTSSSTSTDIGQITASCSGTGTGFSLASEWIDGVGSSKLFDTPLVPSVAVAGGTVTFTSTVGITPAASLAHNPNYK